MHVFVYITNPNEPHAKRIARLLIEQRLIGCANIFPVNSLYRWKGKVQDETEVILLAKTTDEKFPDVQKVVSEHHEYETPCITKIPVTPNEKYATWLQSELS